jgi:hypothetical protein
MFARHREVLDRGKHLDLAAIRPGEAEPLRCDSRIDAYPNLDAGPARRHFGITGERVDDLLRPGADRAGLRVATVIQINAAGASTKHIPGAVRQPGLYDVNRGPE